MHRFFSAGLEPLHMHILDLLAAGDSVHALLPLLAVSRSFRRLAISRMLRDYETAKVVRWEMDWEGLDTIAVVEEGEFILFCHSGWTPDGASEQADPRSLLSPTKLKNSRRESCPLLFSSIDFSTMICTFKLPKGPMGTGGIGFSLHCNDDFEPWSEPAGRLFEVVPTGWVRKAKRATPFVLDGYELGARPDRFPPVCEMIFSPEIPKTPKRTSMFDGFAHVEVKDEKFSYKHDWSISYRNERIDGMAYALDPDLEMGTEIPSHLEVKELKLPFIDLFAPRETHKTKQYYEW